jgi:hypothetical protein
MEKYMMVFFSGMLGTSVGLYVYYKYLYKRIQINKIKKIMIKYLSVS